MDIRFKNIIYGVVRKDKRSVPGCVLQPEYQNKANKARARGTLKVVLLKGDLKVEGLVALSYYDGKPFYILTNATENVE